jgi:hypothetical protein
MFAACKHWLTDAVDRLADAVAEDDPSLTASERRPPRAGAR